MGKAGGGLIQVEINLVMSEEGPMQQASISEAAHANYGNPSAMSTQKALQEGAETRELLGGTEENSVSPMRGH